jgi:TQXA domain-containing protein/LPXTG-motif cell wall-anchored protein
LARLAPKWSIAPISVLPCHLTDAPDLAFLAVRSGARFTHGIETMRTLSLPFSPRRLGALALVAGAVLLGLSGPASAAGATGTVDTHHTVGGVPVEIAGKRVSTSLIPINFEDGERVLTYCIDFTTSAVHRAPMIEDAWANYPNPATNFKAKPANVNWILHNSFPNQRIDALRTASGIEGLSEQQAIAGSQLAIWHFSNNTTPSRGNQSQVLALYAYLTGPKNVGLQAEPAPALTIAPGTVTGKAGGKLGPITVRTTAKTVKLAFRGDSGATLVGRNGAPATEAGNGTELYVAVPAGANPGKATVTAEVSAPILTGRLFRGDRVRTQTLITATTSKVTVDGRADAAWALAPVPTTTTTPTASPSPSSPSTPAPTVTPSATTSPTSTPTPAVTPTSQPGQGGGLPVTGVQTGFIAAIGALLLGGGAALFFFTRRRRLS